MFVLMKISRHCRSHRFCPKRKCFGCLVISGLFLLLFFTIGFSYLWEFAIALQFRDFKYPLNVNLDIVVQKVKSKQDPGVEPINNHNYSFIISCDKKCEDENGNEDNVFILFLVKSKMQHFEQRDIIRRTWAREQAVVNANIRRVFLLGVQPKNKALQHDIDLEAADNEDIIQQNFVDAYYNNTIKLMMGFQWAVQHCQGAKFLAFMDDDYYLNTYNLINLLQSVKPVIYNNLIIGYILQNYKPVRTKRKKWYITEDKYPYKYWPPYPTGGSFVVPLETAEKLYIGMQYTKVLPFDDVFVGIVAWKLKVQLWHNSNFHYFKYNYDKEKYRSVIASHGYGKVEELRKVWEEQMEPYNT